MKLQISDPYGKNWESKLCRWKCYILNFLLNEKKIQVNLRRSVPLSMQLGMIDWPETWVRWCRWVRGVGREERCRPRQKSGTASSAVAAVCQTRRRRTTDSSASSDSSGVRQTVNVKPTPMPGTVNLSPRPIAGCCHLANLTAWCQSHWPSNLKVSTIAITIVQRLQTSQHRNKDTNTGPKTVTQPLTGFASTKQT